MRCPTCGSHVRDSLLAWAVLSTVAFVLSAYLTLGTLQAVGELKANVTLLRQTDFSLRQAVYQNWRRGVPR